MSDVVEKIKEMLNEEDEYQSVKDELKKQKTTDKQAKLLYNYIINKKISEKDLVHLLIYLNDKAILASREHRTS